MKRLLLSLIFLLVAFTGLQAQTIWDGSSDTSWYNETSTEFKISTARQLAGLMELTNYYGTDFSGKTILLTADIVLNDTSDWENWENSAPNNTWTPIGSDYYSEFRGTFDGQGHTINGIYINSENSAQGLFGHNSGTIKNVGVKESYINGSSRVGGVCGENNYEISNCYNSGTVHGNGTIGGVCGSNESSKSTQSTLANCYNSGIVTGGSKVGGVCGYNDRRISNCYNTGAVSGDGDVGGVCGENDYEISDCYNTGTVSGDGDVGGVCGYNYSSTISNCYYLEGTVRGGIDGEDISGQAEVKTDEQFASGEVCWLLNGKQSEGAWGQKLGTDPYPVLGDPAVFKDGETYYNKDDSAIAETNSGQTSFVIVSENLTINIYGSEQEATVYNLAGNIVYNGPERNIPVQTAGMYIVRIGDEIQKTVVR